MNRIVHILGVPLDHGAGRRGVGMGPSALRVAGLHGALAAIGCQLADLGDIDIAAPETLTPGDSRARYLALIAAVCEQVCRRVCEVLDNDGFPLVIGGDHSVAIGTIAGIASHLSRDAMIVRSTGPGSSGSMRTATSILPTQVRVATFTACRSPVCWARVRPP